MFYIGIDIAKNAHEVAILSNCGELVGSTLKITNTTAGAQKLLNYLAEAGVPTDKAIIGTEATCHYRLAIYSFLVGQGFTVKDINLIVIDSYRNMSIRKAKTDQIDAVAIRLGEHKEFPTAN